MAEIKLKLKCYGAIDSNGEVCQINSCQYKKWASDYKKDLKSYFDVRRHYSDPDCSYDKGDHSFFEDLEIFLNEQEEKMSDRLQGRFQYSFTEGKGIEVSSVDSEGKTVKIFYLRSDQLGFSAPVNAKSYPYDLYIEKYEDKDKAAGQGQNGLLCPEQLAALSCGPNPFINYIMYEEEERLLLTGNIIFKTG